MPSNISSTRDGVYLLAVQAVVLAHAGQILVEGHRFPNAVGLLQLVVDRVVPHEFEFGAASLLVREPSLLHLPAGTLATHFSLFYFSLGTWLAGFVWDLAPPRKIQP
ncbi:unnamed protein product [Linum trigynum]|uniref:Uncharacterized protein n=1 Tax=Linum trigynum TaxID=586398 RepID=A0AAV2FIY3_9ROSI